MEVRGSRPGSSASSGQMNHSKSPDSMVRVLAGVNNGGGDRVTREVGGGAGGNKYEGRVNREGTK